MSASSTAHQAFCKPLREAVHAREHLGRKRAIFEVARFFGLTERRVKAAFYNEVKEVLAPSCSRCSAASPTTSTPRPAGWTQKRLCYAPARPSWVSPSEVARCLVPAFDGAG